MPRLGCSTGALTPRPAASIKTKRHSYDPGSGAAGYFARLKTGRSDASLPRSAVRAADAAIGQRAIPFLNLLARCGSKVVAAVSALVNQAIALFVSPRPDARRSRPCVGGLSSI